MNDSEKIIELIDTLRSNLGNFDLARIPDLPIFRQATQATVFSFDAPDITVVFFRSIQSEQDKAVKVLRNIPFASALDALPELWQVDNDISVGTWGGPEETVSLSIVYEKVFRYFFENIGSFLTSNQVGFTTAWFYPKIAVLVSVGKPCMIKPSEIIDGLMSRTKRQYPSHRYFAHTGHGRTGYFGRLPAGVTIGNRPKRSFKDDVEAGWQQEDVVRFSDKYWTEKIEGVDVVVFSAGAIAADSSHSAKALSVINLILAALSQGGTACAQMTEVELGRIQISGHGDVWSHSVQHDPVRVSLFGSSTISETELLEAFKIARLVEDDEQLCYLLKIQHSAFVHVMSGEYLQAFILSWTIIELSLTRRWHRYIDKHTGDEGRRRKLKLRRDLIIDILVEVISLDGELDETSYTTIQSIRKMRNDVIHNAMIPSGDNAHQCLLLAAQLLSDEFAMLSGVATRKLLIDGVNSPDNNPNH